MGDESVILEGVEELAAPPSRASTVHAQVARRAVPGGGPFPLSQAGRGRANRPRAGAGEAGVVDWPAVQARLREQGIVLVGGGADEALEVYEAPAGGPGPCRLDPREEECSGRRSRDGGRDVHDP